MILATPFVARAATQTVDLDGQAANGAESACELDVLGTFPVKIQNKVTNKAQSDAFNFSWKSAGPGGFTSSAPAGSSGGVGAVWTWTTNNTVYAYTGNSCDTDVCFSLSAGPDQLAGTCSLACLNDGVTVTMAKGTNPGDVIVSWTGGSGTYTVYRSTSPGSVNDPANQLGTTGSFSYPDSPPAGVNEFYISRASTCLQPKACHMDSDCNPTTEGTCISRGPFAVPGRSLTSTAVTVSSASLTSSLITFFSPPTEVFHVTSIAQPGGTQQTLTNNSTSPVTAVTQEYPPGCCPANPGVAHQLKCGETCVDYLDDPNNCGACGNVCGQGTCCTNGNCASLCGQGQTWCNGQCVDFQDDDANCGACGNVCGDGTCCSGGVCASLCAAGQTWCNGECVNLQSDSASCGTCGAACGDGTCCNAAACASLCGAGQTWCNGKCVNFQSDSGNCGACGTTCGAGTCCSAGTCASLCAARQTFINGQCYDLMNDSGNCGAVGHACGAGTCCNAGACASLCPAGQLDCNGRCVDLQNDSSSCGACGNVCGTGSCCSAGACASECAAGRTFCGSACYDLQNDPSNCGACGNVCLGQSVCTGGTCVACDGHAGAKNACDNRCVNENTDPYNCGGCGISCNTGCPSGFQGVCSNGQSCRCDQGTPAPPPPPNTPVPAPAVCSNPHPTQPGPAVCPNPHPSPGPVGGFCPNTNPTVPVAGVCPNPSPTGPVAGTCPNSHPSQPVAGACPNPGPPVPPVSEAPVCQVNASTTTIPAGSTTTTCQPGGVLFKEVSSAVSVCGDTVPGPDGSCSGGVSHVSKGTFMRLLPDTTTPVGNAYLTPFAVHVTSDASGDGLLQPGETASLVFDVLNAGPVDVSAASAALSAATVDLTQDGVDNPVAITILSGSSSYGTIAGTAPTTNCTPPVLHPASNASAFQITVPATHPGDTSHPFTLQFNGTLNGNPFAMSVPVAVGIAHNCVYAAALRDYDGLDGMLSPMAKLVPTGDAVPFPNKAFNSGSTVPMKLRQLCGGQNLKGADVDAPQITALTEQTRGPIDISTMTINDDDNSSNPFFRWNDSTKQWIFNMRTAQLGTGTFTVTIRIASRKDYVSGFVLR